MSLHVMIDLQCPNNAGGIAALNRLLSFFSASGTSFPGAFRNYE